jgi:hypothetical protein
LSGLTYQFSVIRESVNTTTSAMLEAAGLKKTADILPLQRKR